MFLPDCAELVELYFACWMLDAITVPLNHRYLEREARFALEHSGAVALVTHPELVDRIDGIAYDEIGISARFIAGDARDGWRAFASLMSRRGGGAVPAPCRRARVCRRRAR